jgi:RNA-binding protein
MKNKELIQKAHSLEPIIRIGKNGINETVVKELKQHLKKRKLIKVKLLKAFVEGKNKKKWGLELASATNSELVQVIGSVVVLVNKND